MARRNASRKHASKKQNKVLTQGLAGAAMLAAGTQAYGGLISAIAPPDVPEPGLPGANAVTWDIDGDGADDFEFNYKRQFSQPYWQSNVYTKQADNGIVGYVGDYIDYADRLDFDVSVDELQEFMGSAPNDQICMASLYNGDIYGGFADDAQGFLGLKFMVGSETHYAWLLLRTGPGIGIDFIAAAYASDPNEPAITPEPGSLAALALGAAAWLRRRP